MAHGAARARRRGSPRRGAEVARLVRARARSRARRVGDRVPHAAERDVDGQRPEPFDLERRVEGSRTQGTFVSSTLSTRPSRQRTEPRRRRRRLEPEHRLGLAQLDHAGLEQHGRDADRVRARHGRILGRLHDHVPEGAVGARRGNDQVRVGRDGAARFAQQEAAQRVVCAKRLHLLEHRSPGGGDAGDDDVPHLAARVAPDDGDRAPRPHDVVDPTARAPTTRREVLGKPAGNGGFPRALTASDQTGRGRAVDGVVHHQFSEQCLAGCRTVRTAEILEQGSTGP